MRHGVAGGPVGYKHRMRDGMGARATQRPHRIGEPRDAGIGPLTVCGVGERDMGSKGRRKHKTTAPWDWETSRHGVVNHGRTMGSLATGSRENCPELRDGREVSAGVRVNPEVPG